MQIKFFSPGLRLTLVAYLIVAVITAIDFFTGYEASSSILYLVPIYYLATKPSSRLREVVILALVCTLAWLLVDIFTDHSYLSYWIFFWNTLVRAGIFLSTAMVVKKLTQKSIMLAKANEQLQHLNQEKNKFIGIAAHDLRSPMGNIYSLSGMLLDKQNRANLTEIQLEFITMTNKISHNTLAMLDNLLDVAQIEAGTLKIRKQKADYISFVEEIIHLNQLILSKKQQKLILLKEVGFLELSFDPTYLGQVLNNLLTNAMKFSYPETEIKVKISFTKNHVKTEVIDQGMGIRDQDKDKIFSPFEKAQNVPTNGERSSGLGLAIVRKIVEAHQGEMAFSSVYGKGSNFYFLLPLNV